MNMSGPFNHLGSIWFGLFYRFLKQTGSQLYGTKKDKALTKWKGPILFELHQKWWFFFTAGPSYFVRALGFTMSGYIVKMIIIFTKAGTKLRFPKRAVGYPNETQSFFEFRVWLCEQKMCYQSLTLFWSFEADVSGNHKISWQHWMSDICTYLF